MESQTKMAPAELAGWIRKAGKAQRTLEFQCPYVKDFFVQITYASKFILTQIREVAREIWTNPRTREREEKMNDDKLRKEYAKQIIAGWRGLTVEKLSKFLPGIKIEGATSKDTEVPFEADVAVAFLEVSIEFENWVVSTATEVENYSSVAEQKKAEFENLA